MSSRYKTISVTTASIAAGASLDTNTTGLSSHINLVKIKITPVLLELETAGPFDLKIFKKDTFLDADLLAWWDNVQPAIYYPTDDDTGGEAEEGQPIPYDDEDGTSELHWRITNNDSTARTYIVTILYEDVTPSSIFKALQASAAGADSATAQPWFPTAGAVTLEANTTYFFGGYLRTSRAAGTVSHTTSLIFSAGTLTFFALTYKAQCNTGDVVTNAAENQTASEVATATVVKAASTSATEQIAILVTGVLRVNAAGTFIPGFQYSAAPGGAPTIMAETYFRLIKEGHGSVMTRGTWA